MAPECYDNHVTPKVDVWALGIATELLENIKEHAQFIEIPQSERVWKPTVGQVYKDISLSDMAFLLLMSSNCSRRLSFWLIWFLAAYYTCFYVSILKDSREL